VDFGLEVDSTDVTPLRSSLLNQPRSLYDGDLGAAVPTGWHHALDRRRLLVLLVASSGVDGPDRAAAFDAARHAGGVVGAQIRNLPSPNGRARTGHGRRVAATDRAHAGHCPSSP